MQKNIFKLSMVTAAIAFMACGENKKEENAVKNTGIDLSNIDSTIKPSDDFFQFVNGNCLKNNPIPESESRWGSFNELYEKNTSKLRAILEEAAADKAVQAGSNKQKIGDYYSVAIDSVKLNKDGVSPLKDEFALIEKISNTEELIKAIAHFHMMGINPMFSEYIGQDSKISSEYITQFFQGGIGIIISIR